VRELALPTRNYEQLLVLQPGVSTALASDQLYVGVSNPTGLSNQVNFAVNGNRPTQNSWTVDGADNFDRGANLTLLNYPSIDSIAEFNGTAVQLLAGERPEFRRNRQRCNPFWHEFFPRQCYEFFRNDVMAANTFFNNRFGIARPPLRWNDFGFTVGGPIIRARLSSFIRKSGAA